MVLITFQEAWHIIVVTAALGYIFMPQLSLHRRVRGVESPRFSLRNFLFAAAVTAPAIILHEMGHKFIAVLFGISATFKAWYFGLVLGILLSIIRSPLIILAPGYVEIGGGTNVQQATIAFAGPFINLVLFLVAKYVLDHKKRFTRTQAIGWYFTKQINLFLLIFNLLPIPPLDGSKVFGNLFKAIF